MPAIPRECDICGGTHITAEHSKPERVIVFIRNEEDDDGPHISVQFIPSQWDDDMINRYLSIELNDWDTAAVTKLDQVNA